jgi:hypothetical protein
MNLKEYIQHIFHLSEDDKKPLVRWFDAFEKALKKLRGSYSKINPTDMLELYYAGVSPEDAASQLKEGHKLSEGRDMPKAVFHFRSFRDGAQFAKDIENSGLALANTHVTKNKGKYEVIATGLEARQKPWIRKAIVEFMKKNNGTFSHSVDDVTPKGYGPYVESRQLKDPKKEVMVVDKKGKVVVIDRKDLKDYERKGYQLAEAAYHDAMKAWDKSDNKKVNDILKKKMDKKWFGELHASNGGVGFLNIINAALRDVKGNINKAVDWIIDKYGLSHNEYKKLSMQSLTRNIKRMEKDFGEAAEQGWVETGEWINEVSPPGWEGTVKAMKKHPEIDNPWALAWSMKNKGYKSHKSVEEELSDDDMCTGHKMCGIKNNKHLLVNPLRGYPHNEKEEEEIQESADAHVSNVAGGEVAGIAPGEDPPVRKKRKKFAGCDVFEVDTDTYYNCVQGKKKFEHWKRYFDKESGVGAEIYEFAYKHPRKAIIVQNRLTKEMVYLRHKRK